MSQNKDDVVEGGDVDAPSEPQSKQVNLPAEVALLPIRNRVLLPGGLLRLTIGRPKSVSSSMHHCAGLFYIFSHWRGINFEILLS